MINTYPRNPMRDRLVGQRQFRRRPHFSVPQSPGGRRLSRRRVGLLVAFGVAIAANLVVILAHGRVWPSFLGLWRPAASASGATVAERAPARSALTPKAGPLQPVTAPTASTSEAPPPSSPAGVEEIVAESAAVAPTAETAPAIHLVSVGAIADALPVDVGASARAASPRARTFELKSHQTLAGALQGQGLSSVDVNGVVAALAGLFDFRRVRPGDGVTIRYDSGGALGEVEYHSRTSRGPGALYVAYRNGDELVGEQREVAIETRRALVSGEVHSTLYESILATGEGTRLIKDFTEVFGWEIDFYREVREGDRFKALVEKRFVDDRFIGYGRLLAAEYGGAGGVHRAFHFEGDDAVGYYNQSGESMQKTFLKSPVEVTRITSPFGKRFHPIHKRHKQHNGVDYGAPIGTPVWTVADGTVTVRKYDRGLGNYVKVRHPNGYETVYGHLSRFGDVKVGSKVKQRQVIGYCGSTGLSTGPHVHYGMLKTGGYVNPFKQKFPRGRSVPAAERPAFAQTLRSLTSELDAIEIALAEERFPGQG